MAQVGSVPRPRLDRRVVYLEDEFDDSGDEDEFDFGFLNAKMDNLPALCSNNCGEAALTTAYSEAEHITTGMCSRAAPTCNVDTVQNLAQSAYAPPAPYEMARPPSISASSMTHNLYPKERKTPERYNYAKALLDSDKELERLARRIRSEIRQEEILELALEAERAADAGEERFTGRASTFGSDVARVGLKNSPEGKGSKSYRRNRTLSEGIARTPNTTRPNTTRIGVLALRDAGEVIPDFNELHAHMRTHLARQNVNKDTLSFREMEPEDGTSEKQQQERLEDESPAEHLALRSMVFLENIADLSMQHMAAQGMYPGYHNCSPRNPALAEMVDDTSVRSAASSQSDRFGRTLSDHISPVKGADLRRPRVEPLPGLSATEESEASFSLPKRSQKIESHTRTLPLSEGGTRSLAVPELTPKSRTFHKRQSSDDEQNGDRTADTEDTSSSSESFPATPEKKEPENDFSTASHSPASALFNAHHYDENSESSCSPIELTPVVRAVSPSPESPKTTTMPRMSRFERRRRKSDPRYATPTGLRDIRGSRSKSGTASPLNVPVFPDISTPELNPMMAFEPSSIIDSGGGSVSRSPRQRTRLIKTEEAMFLALPSIQNVPNERYFRARKLTPKQTEENRKLLRPRQRPNPEGNMNTSELTTLISMRVAIPEGDDEHSAYSYSGYRRVRANSQPEMESEESMKHVPTSSAESSPHTDAWWDFKEKAILPENQFCIPGYPNIVEQRQDDALDQAMLSKVNNDEQNPLSSSNHSKPDTADDLEGGPSEVPEEEMQVFAEETKQEDRDHTTDGVENLEQSQSKTPAETIAAGVCKMYQSFDAAQGASCSSECNVSVSSAEDFTQLPLDKPSGEDLKHPPLHPSVSWGGHCSHEAPDIRRVLSLSGVGTIESAIPVNHDLEDADKQLMYPDPDMVCNHISSAAKNVTNTSFTTKEDPTCLASTSFQTTVGDVISRFTPTCQESHETSIYYPESENSEFLNNFFYCSKNEDGEVPLSHQPQSAADRYACAEPCEGIDQFDNCHVGDAIRGGFDFIFRPNRVVHRSSSTSTLKPAMQERALSVGRIDDPEVHSRGWFGVIDMSSSRFFPFPNSGKDAADKQAYQFQLQPPCLKKSLSYGPSKMSSRTKQRQYRAKSSLISGDSFDKYLRSHQFPEGATSESQFQALCGMSRDAFLSLPKEDRVRVAAKVEDNFPHLQRKEPLIPFDSVGSHPPSSPGLSRRARQAALMESLDLSAIRLETLR
jgi:hypothetical protein